MAIGTYRPLERMVQDFIAYLASERTDLLDDPATRMAVAEASMRVEVGRALATNNAAMVHNDLVPTMEAAMAKVWKGDSSERIHDAFMDVLGRSGGLHESNEDAPLGGLLEAAWRSDPPHRFAGGTNDIQRRVIATRGLQLPR